MEFGYWKCQGRSEVSVYVLHYIGKDFTIYNPPDFQEWSQKKQKMQDEGFFAPNLPYLIDGDYKLSESQAIPIYLLKKYGKEDMLGKNTEEMGRVCQLGGIFGDQMKDMFEITTTEEYKESYDKKLQTLQTRLKKISDFLGDKEYLMGYLTLADFQMHFIMKNYDWISKVLKVENEFEKFDNLKKHSETIYNLPELKEFFEEREKNPLPFLPTGYAKIPQP